MWHSSAFCNDWLPLYICIVQSFQESIENATYLCDYPILNRLGKHGEVTFMRLIQNGVVRLNF